MKIDLVAVAMCCLLVPLAKSPLLGQATPQSEPAEGTPVATESAGGESDLDENEEYELMKLFVDTLDEVQRNYVKPVSRRELMEAAIDGVLAKLDKYSDYIPPEEFDQFRTEVESEFGGIGIQIRSERGRLIVITPLNGSPGKRAGLRPGDHIFEVDGQSTENWSIQKAVSVLKGKTGTEVQLKVRHRSGGVEDLTIRRGNVLVETVLSHARSMDGDWQYMLDKAKKIGYIRITTFSEHTPEELKSALTQLQDQGLRGLVLDLRFNPGGLLTSAIEVCDLFLPAGMIVSTSGRNVETRTWHASRKEAFTGFPIAVLVNQFSASASEIVSACLQDHDRATIVGHRTWGKGSVQRVVELERGKSALKLTTASYFRPSGKNIHRSEGMKDSDDWGVRPDPDFDIDISQDELWRIRDFQIQSAILPDAESGAQPVFIDSQLERALSHLKSEAN